MTEEEADRAFLALLDECSEMGEPGIINDEGILTRKVLEEAIKAYKRRYPDPLFPVEENR